MKAVTITSVTDDVDMLQLLIKNVTKAKLNTSLYEGTALIASTHLGYALLACNLIKTGARAAGTY